MALRPILLVASLVCLILADLIETAVVHGSDFRAWLIGGLAFFVASFLPWPS